MGLRSETTLRLIRIDLRMPPEAASPGTRALELLFNERTSI